MVSSLKIEIILFKKKNWSEVKKKKLNFFKNIFFYLIKALFAYIFWEFTLYNFIWLFYYKKNQNWRIFS